ncbi:hypothetical protein FE783_05845 [Paenibacillus mesophilus]|uniref:fibronectin type III domain-containing protein n=1 Tax=Paenibacillus mesophilus TaxID=2582849 RepID=UPI00110E71CF|nr:hypothetical protein [Paenibacillus mesophilus]TMV51304.1 hypothetical protein FE783_05845 [Paenibacillus mesophilus]
MIMLVWCMMFAGTAVYAETNAAPGLLRGKPASPPAPPRFAVTDGQWQTYETISNESIVWSFPRPVDLTGFILYADSPDAQLYMIDSNGIAIAAAGASTTVPSAPFAIDVDRVKSLRLTSANPGQSIRVYELDVYGSVSPIAPSSPTGLVAAGSDGAVQLSWDADLYATGYRVKRSMLPSGPYSVVQTVYGGTQHRDTTVVNGTPYYYVVSAFNEFGESANSAPVWAYPYQSAPAAPAHLTASAGDGQVVLQWETVTGAVYYHIKRSVVPGGNYTTVASSVYGYYMDSAVENGTVYSYVVTAVNGAGESAPSTPASVVPFAPLPDRVLLNIVLTGGAVKEYDLSVPEAAAFVSWYETRSNGAGPAAYPLIRNDNKGPFVTRTDYIAFPSIVSFEANAYKSR